MKPLNQNLFLSVQYDKLEMQNISFHKRKHKYNLG